MKRKKVLPRVQTAGAKPSRLKALLNPPPRFPNVKTSPPGWLLDVLAESKLSGEPIDAQRKRKVVCPWCHEMQSLSGSCSCN